MLFNRLFSDINPVSCGEHRCAPGHIFGPNIRFYHLVHFVVSGKGWFSNGEKRYDLTKGQIFIIRPNQLYTYGADIEDPWHYRWIGFTSRLDLSGILSDDVVSIPECDYLFRMMVDADSFAAGKEYYLCAKVYELFSLLIKRSVPSDTWQSYIEIAKNYIEVNYNNPDLSISQIAENLNLDRSYFSTIFKRQTGKSPQTYLMDLRLNKAAEMLIMKVMKANEVGRACGYNDPYHFSKAFKKKFNVSPSGYGKIHIPDKSKKK